MITPYLLIIKVPTRERPTQFFERLEEMLDMMDDKVNYQVIISLDTNDPTMNNTDIIQKLHELQSQYNIIWHYGISRNKVAAINRDIPRDRAWDILFSWSDDMRCSKQGWDNDIRQAFDEHYPTLDGFLHFWDGDPSTRNTDRGLCTYSIMGRKYYNRFCYIYHPSYASLWCDNEATEVAQVLGKYTYNDTVLFTHYHFSNQALSGIEQDNLMRRTQTYFRQDENRYRTRKKANFKS